MPIGEPPPLHPNAITGKDEIHTPQVSTVHLDAEVIPPLTTNTISADKLTRFPTYALEPYQYQRAIALDEARAILGEHAMIEDVIRAAAFIESGKLPDG